MSEPQKPQKAEQPPKETPLERVFLANDILPNAAEAFGDKVEPIEKAINSADIVLDTNVLLLPYGAGASSLKKITEAFEKLKAQGRVFLPAQVAREFVKNRPNKLSELQQGLSDKISRYVAIDKLSFPILEGLDEYKKLNESLEKSSKLKTELSKANLDLIKKIRSWEWNDPVNTAYRDVFSSDRIIEPTIDKEQIIAELQKRQKYQIPPGYKDSAKEDLGIGDFLIWKMILEIGSKNKKHVIFVSGEEKADWQHRSGGSGFLPRYELMDEFRRISSGKSFYIVQLSTLLELLKVDKGPIEEIKKEEERMQQVINVIVDCPYCRVKIEWHLADHVGASAAPFCPACGEKFHINRTRDGVTTHRRFERVTKELGENALEKVVCPQCKNEVEGALGTYTKATAWLRCDNCEYLFPIHRRADGSILISSPSKADIS